MTKQKFKVGNQYESNNYGPVEVLELLPKEYARIKFLRTGAIREAQRANITQGRVRDTTVSVLEDQSRYKIKVGRVYQTNFYGNVVVTGRVDSLNVVVRFLDSGEERTVRTSALHSGNIRDRSAGKQRTSRVYYGMRFEPGTILKTKRGLEFEIVNFINSGNVHIRFVETGTERWVTADIVSKGKIGDYMSPSVCGIGYLGTETPEEYHEGAKCLWRGILKRVVNQKANYKICERWLCMKDFAEDIKEVPGYNEWLAWKDGKSDILYHLDKDFLVAGNRTYEPGKVIFVSAADNLTEVNLRKSIEAQSDTEVKKALEQAYATLRDKVLNQ